jgi:hypothetical protein
MMAGELVRRVGHRRLSQRCCPAGTGPSSLMRVEGADQRDDKHAVGAMSRRAALAASMSAVIGGAVFSASACSSATPPQAPPAAMPQNALITLGVQAGPPPVPTRPEYPRR